MNHESILEHSKKMEEITKEKIERRRKDRDEFMTRHVQSYDYSKY